MKGKIFLVFLAILGLSQATCRCGKNEVWSKCGNNDCQVTCANPSPPSDCNNKCCAGCICKPGYLRNTEGFCVVPVECDTCNANQTFSECGNNGCRNTCTDPNLNTVCDPLPGCFPGCICRDNLLINSNGDCVEPFDCDNCGGDPNKVYYGCGDLCPVTCANKDGPIACPATCKIPGDCGCRPGLVRDINGNCIHPDDCPKCGPNEFYDCGSACDTECATLGQPCPIINIKCVERCYCKEGYARNKNGVCILIEKCPKPKPTPKPKCPVNEVWTPDCPDCPEQCDNIGKPRCKSKKAGCACVSGYVREKKGGKCIKKSLCKKY